MTKSATRGSKKAPSGTTTPQKRHGISKTNGTATKDEHTPTKGRKPPTVFHFTVKHDALLYEYYEKNGSANISEQEASQLALQIGSKTTKIIKSRLQKLSLLAAPDVKRLMMAAKVVLLDQAQPLHRIPKRQA